MTLQHRPTQAQRTMVEQLSAFGTRQVDIAMVMKITANTLALHYREELNTGMIKANAKVAASLFKIATGNGKSAVTAQIFWLKTRAGWKDTTVVEHVGEIDVIRRIIIDPGHADTTRISSPIGTETI